VRRTALSTIVFELPSGKRETLQLDDIEARRAAVDCLLAELKYLPMKQRHETAHRLARKANVDLPAEAMMSSQQIKTLRREGMQIGAHTVSHPILATLERDVARHEIGESKRFLEELLGEPVTLFAYPNGKPDKDFTAGDVSLVGRLGFEAAVSTAPGAASMGSDPMQLPRFTPWDRKRSRFGAQLARNLWASGRLSTAEGLA
jgi:peptidoglycan/xylan/chitin deacetylase (PgdA/CDA1 family)